MQDTNSQAGNPLSRPMARPVGAPTPIQRGNYGIPPRQPVATRPIARPPQPVPMAATNQFMDIAPAPVPAPVVTPTAVPIQPPAQPMPAPALPQQPVQPTQRPLFTPNPVAAQPVAAPRHHRPKLFKVVHISVAVVATLLLLAGIGRWATAGSTAKDTIAVGAVSANDGRSMTIQFTATDGKLHKFSTVSDQDLIPGSATEIAYRSGAPEATARQVAVIKDNRNLGVLLVLVGVAGFGAYGAMTMVVKLKQRGKHRATPLTTALTA